MSLEFIAPELGGGIGMGSPGLPDIPDFNDPTPGGSAAGTSLGLNAAPETDVVVEFVRQVRRHPDLRGVGTVIRAWTGQEGDDRPPTADELPWLRFMPLPGRREREATEGVWYSPIAIHVEQITSGSAVDDSLNLFSVVRTMIESASFRAAMAEAGATSVSYDEGGYGERPHLPRWEPNPEATITSLGTITIDLYIEYGA